MAQPGGRGPHQHLVRTDGADLHVVDDQLARNVLEHRSLHRGDTNELRPTARRPTHCGREWRRWEDFPTPWPGFEAGPSALVSRSTNGEVDERTRGRLIVRGFALGSVIAAAALLGGCAFVTPATVSTAGQQADGAEASGPSLSFTGRFVAFNARSDNLVPGDTNGARDAFVRDLVTGVTERVSIATGGAQAHGDSQFPMLDYAGRMVAFTSDAPDLVAGDTNGVQDVFVHDRATGATTRVSVSSSGAQANDASGMFARPAISGNGRYVVFHSAASNLVPNDTNGVADVFLRDLWTGTTELVSRSSDGGSADGGSVGNFSISADGRFVAFDSGADNLVAGDTNGRIDGFVCDRQLGRIIRVSVASDGTQANGDTQLLGTWISGDGRFVTFQSSASNLVPNDTNNASDVFVHDRLTGATERDNVASDGAQALGGNPTEYTDASLSYDGRYVSFDETATNLVTGDTNNSPDTFVHDRLTGRTERVSAASDGTQGDASSGNHLMSADGRYVAFGTVASNLFPNDANYNGFDIVVSAVLRPVISSVAPQHLTRGASWVITVHGAWFATDALAALGDGILVRGVQLANPTTLRVTVDVAATAVPGSRSVIVANPGSGPGDTAGAATVCRNCITVD